MKAYLVNHVSFCGIYSGRPVQDGDRWIGGDGRSAKHFVDVKTGDLLVGRRTAPGEVVAVGEIKP